MSKRYQIESIDGTIEGAVIRDTETGKIMDDVMTANINFDPETLTTLTFTITTDDFCINPMGSGE